MQNRVLAELFVRMLDGEPIDVRTVLADVQVNAGRPAWAQDSDG